MSRKKREIQKRKRQQPSRSGFPKEDIPDSAPRRTAEGGTEGAGSPDPEARTKRSSRPGPLPGSRGTARRPAADGENALFSRGRENLLLGLLALYVLLLGLGTFGELFEVEWILNLPLFR
jgi:hypothetical protein